MDSNIKKEIKTNFEKRNIEVSFYDNIEELKKSIFKTIPINCTVGLGNSKTLKYINISEMLTKRGNVVYDKTKARNSNDTRKIKKKSLLTDWYISGSNAVSIDGNIVNIDHSGNRVAALMFGPDNVLVVVGINKITDTLEDAIWRTKNIASPQNAQRAGYNPPCVKLKRCVDCDSKDRVCNYLVVIQGQSQKNRMRIFIVNEEMGF